MAWRLIRRAGLGGIAGEPDAQYVDLVLGRGVGEAQLAQQGYDGMRGGVAVGGVVWWRRLRAVAAGGGGGSGGVVIVLGGCGGVVAGGLVE